MLLNNGRQDIKSRKNLKLPFAKGYACYGQKIIRDALGVH